MMKKFNYLLMVSLMALVSIGFAACGDDEPEVADIVGTWQYDNPEMLEDVAMLFQFTKDGKFHQVVINIKANGTTDCFAFHGTYTVKGYKLSFTNDNDDGYDGVSEAVTCDYYVQGDRLTLLGQEPYTFIRVRASVIEPYL